MGATWGEFAASAPEMTAAGRRLLYQHGPGLGYLATVRRDGAPRVHPVCPHVAHDRLWVFVGHASPKRFDLLRDPRYARGRRARPSTRSGARPRNGPS
jgi:hypothetical protein